MTGTGSRGDPRRDWKPAAVSDVTPRMSLVLMRPSRSSNEKPRVGARGSFQSAPGVGWRGGAETRMVSLDTVTANCTLVCGETVRLLSA